MQGIVDEYRRQVYEAVASVPEADLLRAVDALLAVHQRRATIFVLCPPEEAENALRLARVLEEGTDAGPFAFRLVRLHGVPRDVASWQASWAYEDIYAEQLCEGLRQSDTVVAVSRRGQALGLANALRAARHAGATTIALVGFDGGAVKDEADVCLHVRSDRAEQVDDVHTILVHMLCISLRRRLSAVPGVAPTPPAGE
jgi:phosphoheptose isomerase